ncbi:MAG: glycoside hydrolase [Fibrobacter sp.]|nr:glycoside hydrolase [Fibrobacter sp.]
MLMKNFFKATVCVAALAATSAMAGSFPFPQNMKSPNGYTIPFADTDMIKDHYNKWKAAWYDANQGWILAPEGTCSTVSEAIAYGMLITVYMDDQTVFEKLYGTWKSNGGNGGGMNWRVGCNGGSGSASDADFDAALALVMASKQWNSTSYLDDAKKIISWIASNDINNNQIKPGSQWNDAFNPSYATTANFALFQKVAGGSWNNVISQAYTDLNACQNGTSGLVPDWCSWGSHQPTKTSAAVAQDEEAGFYDDAARTPWRMAWAYYWYGDTKAQAFNKKVANWVIPATHTASGINSGYLVDGTPVKTEKRGFASSTFSGGVGLATSSVNSDEAKAYMETVYNFLSKKTSCKQASGCGEGSNTGEKYYPSTLNILYLLLMTGNMPNLYDMTGFTKFTPDPSLATSVSSAEGEQQASRDSTVGISGFWNWGAYHDKLGIGTVMSPDSGTSPLYKRDCEITADASMEIGPEPEWTAEAAAAGTLKYPSAGIAMSFLSNDKKGVDFTKLGVKSVRVTMKASGPIRMAVLNEKTKEAGAEPGVFVPNSTDYKATTYDLTPEECGFKGFTDPDAKYAGGLLDWVDYNNAPFGQEILTAVTGLKWEVKEATGGVGTLSIKAVEFLDASGNVIDPVLITGITVPATQCGSGTDAFVFRSLAPSAKVIASGSQIQVLGAKVGSDYAVFNMQGKVVKAGKISGATQGISVANRGTFLVRVDGKIHSVTVK